MMIMTLRQVHRKVATFRRCTLPHIERNALIHIVYDK